MNPYQKPKVLIVDDIPTNIRMLLEILKDDYIVIPSTSGVTALKECEINLPDICILDIIMPEMDGFELCKILKSKPHTKDIPIIFITSLSNNEDIVKGFEHGASDYITKPFDKAEVLMRIKTHLSLKFSKDVIANKNASLKELIHVISHDLINPLSSLLEILRLDNQEESIHQFLKENKDIFYNTLKSAVDLINIVRHYESTDDGTIKLELKPAGLKEVIQTSISMLCSKWTEKQIEFILDIREDIIVLIEEVSFINIVISNILTNAIKFSYPESKIYITANTQPDGLILSIKDNGIGIPQEILDNIYKMDHPTARTGTSGEQGIGYGIPLVKKFMSAYGGRIEMMSSADASDHWTDVWLYLNRV